MKRPVMTLSQWKERGAYRSIFGHRIFFREEGHGPALVLLHAYPTASWGWHAMWPELVARYRVLAPDLLGSGFSDKPPGGPYDISWLTDIVEELLRGLGHSELHILAHAYGVLVAQELLARTMDAGSRASALRIRSCCFLNGGLFPEVAGTTFMQRLLLTPLGSVLARGLPSPYFLFRRSFAKAFGADGAPTERETREFWELLRYGDGHRRVPEVVRYLRERRERRDRWVGALTGTETPLCLIYSEGDELTGERTARRWNRLLPDQMLLKLPRASGHYPPLEDPRGVGRAYEEFMASLP